MPRATRSTGVSAVSVGGEPTALSVAGIYAASSNGPDAPARYAGAVLHGVLEQLVCDSTNTAVSIEQRELHAIAGSMWSHIAATPAAVLAEFRAVASALRVFLTERAGGTAPVTIFREAVVALTYHKPAAGSENPTKSIADLVVVQGGRVVVIIDLSFTTTGATPVAYARTKMNSALFHTTREQLVRQRIQYISINYNGSNFREFGYTSTCSVGHRWGRAINYSPPFNEMKVSPRANGNSVVLDKMLRLGPVRITGLVIWHAGHAYKAEYPIVVAGPRKMFVSGESKSTKKGALLNGGAEIVIPLSKKFGKVVPHFAYASIEPIVHNPIVGAGGTFASPILVEWKK